MKRNIIFIQYYRLVSFKFGTGKALKWIFTGKCKGKRYLDCCYWNDNWKSIFEDYGLSPDIKTLEDYFSYLIFKYNNIEYPPSVKTIFSQYSLLKFFYFYRKKYFRKMINKVVNLDEYARSIGMLYTPAVKRPWNRERELIIEDNIKLEYIDRFEYDDIIEKCCRVNRIYFKEESKICSECEYKTTCWENFIRDFY